MKCQKKKSRIVGIIFLIAIFSNINFVLSHNVISVSIGDSDVRAGTPNGNTGTNTDLILEDGLTTQRKRIYALFDITHNITELFVRAEACFYLFSNGTARNVSLYYSYFPFNETVITWNNQLCGTAFDNSTACNLTIIDFKNTDLNGWYCWNISIPVNKSFSQGLRNITVILKTKESSASTDDEFYSKEYSVNTSLRPYIKLDFCSENWINYNTSCGFHCGNWNKFQTYYIDSNGCGSNNTLPLDNGTCYDCNYCTPAFDCSQYNETCSGNPPTNQICMMVNDTGNCCNTTGLSEDCIYTGNLSDFDKSTIIEDLILSLPTYPYIEVNETYPLILEFPTNNLSSIQIYITEKDNSTSIFNFSFTPNYFYMNLLFSEEGNYPFVINGTNPCFNLTGEISGIFYVRKSFNVTFCGYQNKTLNPYLNEFSYLTAELTNSRNLGYVNDIEIFLSPFYNSKIVNPPVFHAFYSNGCGTLRIFEKNQTYAVRIRDGIIDFPYTYAEPNITKSFGTNIYLGTYYLNGSNQLYKVYLSSKEISPYRWLYNWGFIILLILIIGVSFTLFFLVPEVPVLAIGFGIAGTIMLIILRIILWLWIG